MIQLTQILRSIILIFDHHFYFLLLFRCDFHSMTLRNTLPRKGIWEAQIVSQVQILRIKPIELFLTTSNILLFSSTFLKITAFLAFFWRNSNAFIVIFQNGSLFLRNLELIDQFRRLFVKRVGRLVHLGEGYLVTDLAILWFLNAVNLLRSLSLPTLLLLIWPAPRQQHWRLHSLLLDAFKGACGGLQELRKLRLLILLQLAKRRCRRIILLHGLIIVILAHWFAFHQYWKHWWSIQIWWVLIKHGNRRRLGPIIESLLLHWWILDLPLLARILQAVKVIDCLLKRSNLRHHKVIRDHLSRPHHILIRPHISHAHVGVLQAAVNAVVANGRVLIRYTSSSSPLPQWALWLYDSVDGVPVVEGFVLSRGARLPWFEFWWFGARYKGHTRGTVSRAPFDVSLGKELIISHLSRCLQTTLALLLVQPQRPSGNLEAAISFTGAQELHVGLTECIGGFLRRGLRCLMLMYILEIQNRHPPNHLRPRHNPLSRLPITLLPLPWPPDPAPSAAPADPLLLPRPFPNIFVHFL